MKVNIYLSFNGQAEEAFRFYASLFQAEISGLFHVHEMPDAHKFSEDDQQKIIWIALDLGNLTLQGEDVGLFNDIVLSDNHQPNQWLTLVPDSREEAEQLFQQLGEEGTIVIPLEDQFFGNYYGRLIDRFGIGWEVML